MNYIQEAVTDITGLYYTDRSHKKSIALNKGQTYCFDQFDTSNASHPLRFSKIADRTHEGGSVYATDVTVVETANMARHVAKD